MNDMRDIIVLLKKIFYTARICEIMAFFMLLGRITTNNRNCIIFYDLLAIILLLCSVVLSMFFKRIAKSKFHCPRCGYMSVSFAYKVAGWSRDKSCPNCGTCISIKK